MTTNSLKLTEEEIKQFRAQLKDYPEALAALKEIEDDEGDLEYATEILALEAGIEKDKAEIGWLENLAKKCRGVICQEEFRDDLLSGVITTVILSIAALETFGVGLATAVAIYVVKLGVRNFCDATEEE